MQSLPISPPVPGLAVTAESATGTTPAVDEALAGESFGAMLEAQLADSARLTETVLVADSIDSDAAAQGDALMPMDLAALLASVVPVGAQVQTDLAPRTGAASSASRQLSELTATIAKSGVFAEASGLDKSQLKPVVLPDAKDVRVDVDMVKGAVKDDVAADIADTGKGLPFVGIKAATELPVKDQAAGINLAQAVVTTRPDLPLTAAGQANNHAISNLTVEPRVGSAAWDGALGQKVVWLVNQHHQTAEMQLNPPNLGPLEVKLTIANDQASALFVSPHAAVRDALESALPRLREMLAENGITLGNVNVSAESFTREQTSSQDQAQRSGQQGAAGVMKDDDLAMQRSGVMHLPSRGLVDTFA